MNKPLRTLIILVTVLLAVLLLWMWSHRSRNQGALAKYKAELRAKGEKLTWAELGYPRSAGTNTSLQKLLAAVGKISPGKTDPGKLDLIRSDPGEPNGARGAGGAGVGHDLGSVAGGWVE